MSRNPVHTPQTKTITPSSLSWLPSADERISANYLEFLTIFIKYDSLHSKKPIYFNSKLKTYNSKLNRECDCVFDSWNPILLMNYYTENPKEYFDRTFSLDPSSFLAPVAERLFSGAMVLDVGCGSGRDLLWFKNKEFEVIGFERSAGLAELAREHSGVEGIAVFFDEAPAQETSAVIKAEQILCKKNAGG